MKLNQHTDTAQTIGQVQKNAVRIDSENMDKIIQMLSSNLYSNPEESFIREIVSNGWDSCVEAQTFLPIVISLNDDPDQPNFFRTSIRDFGTGLSPERFDQVFRYFGSSTKDKSDDYIGSWGVGRMSSLAVSDMCTINSYHEGTEYIYLMYKNGLSINIDLVLEQPTDQKNGLQVSVSLPKTKLDAIRYAIQTQLPFFENAIVKGAYKVDGINRDKIRHYQNFSISSGVSEFCILLGKVRYPLNLQSLTNLSESERKQIELLSDSGIALRFDIGELDVTPSRENLFYSEKTQDAILQRTIKAIQELHDLKEPELKQDVFNLVSPDRLQLDFGWISIPTYNRLWTICGFKGPYAELKRSIERILNIPTRYSFKMLDDGIFRKIQNTNLWSMMKLRLINYTPSKYKPVEIKWIRQKYNTVMVHKDWSYLLDSSYLARIIMKGSEPKIIKKLVYRELEKAFRNASKFDTSDMTSEFRQANETLSKDATFTLYDLNTATTHKNQNYSNLQNSTQILLPINLTEKNPWLVYDKQKYRVVQVPATIKKKILKDQIGIDFDTFLKQNRRLIEKSAELYHAKSKILSTGYRVMSGLLNYPDSIKKLMDSRDDYYYRYDSKVKPGPVHGLEVLQKIHKISQGFNTYNETGRKYFLEILKQQNLIDSNKTIQI